MKKFFYQLLLCFLLITLSVSPALAASEYKNAGFHFTVPDGLIQDSDFAKENGYIDYWHTEDYLFEATVWEDSLTLVPYPVDPVDGYICHGLKKTDDFSYTLVDGTATSLEINGDQFTFNRSEIVFGDEKIQIYCYIMDDGSHNYKRVTFIVRDDKYLHYIDEITGTLEIPALHNYTKRKTIIIISIAAVAVVTITVSVIKKKKKASKKEI